MSFDSSILRILDKFVVIGQVVGVTGPANMLKEICSLVSTGFVLCCYNKALRGKITRL